VLATGIAITSTGERSRTSQVDRELHGRKGTTDLRARKTCSLFCLVIERTRGAAESAACRTRADEAVQIKLINLDRSPDRLAEFNSVNGHLGDVQRFRAVDGRTLDIEALVKIGLVERAILPTYTMGAIGCALSHLKLWDRAIQGNEVLTICEDDAIFNQHFVACAEYLISLLPADWDLVLWGWNFDSVVNFEALPGVSSCLSYMDQGAMRSGIDAFRTQLISPWLYRLHRAFGLVCYSVSPKGAQLLRDHCLPLREMIVFFPGYVGDVPNNGIDTMANDLYPSINAYVSFPPLVITKNERDRSTIQTD
jgi:glycosyl transferase, family 25